MSKRFKCDLDRMALEKYVQEKCGQNSKKFDNFFKTRPFEIDIIGLSVNRPSKSKKAPHEVLFKKWCR